MPSINELYPSKYLKSDDLQGQRLTLQVAALKVEDVAENEFKPVLYFNGKQRGLVLNKTNAMLCGATWGEDYATWSGQWLELFAEPKLYKGNMVQGLSVAPKLANSASTPQTPAEPEPPANANPDGSVTNPDDIPF